MGFVKYKKGVITRPPTFYETITSSPQWKAWEIEQARRLHKVVIKRPKIAKGVYDMPEVMECGWLGAEHFQDFIKFCVGMK